MIRDTSAQDRRIETTHSPRKRWIVIGAGAAAVLAALIWVVPTVARLISAGSAVSASSVRIAAVKRGTLTRDISAQGKVVAAVSPTLYASSAGT
jgi:HlyD family secretion protein